MVSGYIPQPWFAPASDQMRRSGEDVVEQGARAHREEKGEDHFYGACPLNLQGLDAKTKNDKQSRAEYVNGKNMQLYAIMCFVEPKISADSFN